MSNRNIYHFDPVLPLEPFPTPLPHVQTVEETPRDTRNHEGRQIRAVDLDIAATTGRIIMQPLPQNGDRRGKRGR